MNALQQWMEKHLVPVAAKIGSQKHLVALRDRSLVCCQRRW
jgi:PTS system cellobiose-specific IIC component